MVAYGADTRRDQARGGTKDPRKRSASLSFFFFCTGERRGSEVLPFQCAHIARLFWFRPATDAGRSRCKTRLFETLFSVRNVWWRCGFVPAKYCFTRAARTLVR